MQCSGYLSYVNYNFLNNCAVHYVVICSIFSIYNKEPIPILV